MRDEPGIQLAAGDVIKVSGSLDVTTVANFKDPGNKMIDESSSAVFDLEGVDIIGSAPIALLIAWQRHAIRVGKDISFINTSDDLRRIAGACGVEDILPLA